MTRINVVCGATQPQTNSASGWRFGRRRRSAGPEHLAFERPPGGVYAETDEQTIGGPMDTGIFDADSHLMETPEWLGGFADPELRDRMGSLGLEGAGAGAAELMAGLPELWETHRHQDIGPEVLKGPKGWMAPGALDTEVRSRVLDALRIEAQLVFPTFALAHFSRSKDPDVLYGGTGALNRAMTAFCAPDQRLKAVGYLPLNDPERALSALEEALEAGVAAIWVPSDAPGTSRPPMSTWNRSGPAWPRPVCPSCSTSGAESSSRGRSTTTAVPGPRTGSAAGRTCVRRTFPCSTTRRSASSPAWRSTASSSGTRGCAGRPSSSGRAGCLACCATSITRLRSFSKFEPALQELTMLPSEYLRRQVRFTPFPFEDTAWLLEQCGPDLFMFSTDYPHPEGGKRPFEAFGDAVAGFDESTRERFFWRNGAAAPRPGLSLGTR